MIVPTDLGWSQALGMLGLGLVMAFNPCMLAMGPAAAAHLGFSAPGGMSAGIRLGLAFIAGYALTLALLGTILASVVQVAVGLTPWWPYLLAGLYWILGLYLLLHGRHRSLPVKVAAFYCYSRRLRWPRAGLSGAFLGGFALGFIPSPCATPTVLAVSAYLAPSQQYGLVAWSLFFFGLGHGLPLFLSTLLTASFKVSRWARFVNPVLGSLLIGLGFYFLWQGPGLFLSGQPGVTDINTEQPHVHSPDPGGLMP